MAKRPVRHLVPLVAAVILAGCGGGGDNASNVNTALSAQSAGTASPSAPSPPASSQNPPAPQSATRSVTLDWNPNTEPDLAGYRVYVATASGAYGGSPVGQAPANATSFVVNGLQPGVTYFFVVTAFDTSGNESVRSAEVSVTTSL